MLREDDREHWMRTLSQARREIELRRHEDAPQNLETVMKGTPSSDARRPPHRDAGRMSSK